MEPLEVTAMFAKLVDATIDPDRLDLAAAAVDEELIPGFLEHDGALHGYWSADAPTGHVVAITMWRDADALRSAAAADGALRATVGERIGLRLRSVHTLPVLAWSPGTDPSAAHTDVGWIRLAWIDRVALVSRAQLTLMPAPGGLGEPATGCTGRYWIGEDRSAEGCLLSLWSEAAAPAVEDGAGARHRHRSVRTDGSRPVREYRTFAVAYATSDPIPNHGDLAGVT